MPSKDIRQELAEAKEILRKMKEELEMKEENKWTLRDSAALKIQTRFREWCQKRDSAEIEDYLEKRISMLKEATQQSRALSHPVVISQGEGDESKWEFMERVNLFWNTHPSLTTELDDLEQEYVEKNRVNFSNKALYLDGGVDISKIKEVGGVVGGSVVNDKLDEVDTVFANVVKHWLSNAKQLSFMRKEDEEFFEDPFPRVKRLMHHETSKYWSEMIDQLISTLGDRSVILWGAFTMRIGISQFQVEEINKMKKAWEGYLSKKSSEGLNFNAEAFKPSEKIELSDKGGLVDCTRDELVSKYQSISPMSTDPRSFKINSMFASNIECNEDELEYHARGDPNVPEGNYIDRRTGCIVLQAYYAE